MRNLNIILTNLLILIISSFFIVFSIVNSGEKYAVLGISFIPLIILCFPSILQRKFEPFEPISLLFYLVSFSVTLRSIYIVFSSKEIILFFLDEQSYDSLIFGSLIITLSLTFFVFGYLILNTKILLKNDLKLFNINKIQKKKLILLSLFILTISTLFIYAYISVFSADLSLATLSRKRSVKAEGISTSLAYLSWGSAFVRYLFFTLISYYFSGAFKLKSLLGILMIISGIESFIIPAFSSSRASMISISLYIFFARHTLKKKIKISTIAFIFLFVMLILATFGGLRAISQGQSDSLLDYLSGGNLIDAILKNRNLLDVSKTGFIIQQIPQKLNFQYGATLFAWLVGFIPRSLWAEKPQISLGPTIGKAIYGDPDSRITGTPPGFIAELYLNFGYLGIILGMFLLGFLTRQVKNLFKPELEKKNIFATLVYFPIIFRFSFRLFGGNLSAIMVETITELVSLTTIAFYLRSPKVSKAGLFHS